MRSLLSPHRALVAILVFAGFYAWWALGQYGKLNALHQNELADAALELKSSIETAFENLELFEPDPPNEAGAVAAIPRAPACQFDLDQPYLELEDDCELEWSHWTTPQLVLKRGLELQAVRVVRSAQSEKAAKNSAQARLQLNEAPKFPAVGTKVTFRLTNDTLLGELPFVARFERVFVVNADGRVVYQEAPGLRQRLQRLRWSERGFRDNNAGLTHGLRIESMSDLIGKETGVSWPRLKSVSDHTRVQWGGTQFELYTHPVTLGDGRSDDLVLVGVVPVYSVIREALALDTYLLAPIVFVALVSALGFPFIKLISLSAHERFRMRDIKWLCVSSAALLIVLTFAVLAADVYQRWRAQADTGLMGLARDVGQKFVAEIADVRAALQKDDDIAARSPVMNPRCNPKQSVKASWFNEPRPIKELGFDLEHSVYLDQVSWVDPAGEQLWKITSDRVGKKVNVARRAYYRAVRDGALFETSRKGAPFFVGPEWSITDGRFYTFVSIRSALTRIACPPLLGVPMNWNDEGAAASSEPYVAVAAVRLQSVNRPPLPVGYGFAVINREGRVLYHSDDRLSLRENFFDQLTDGAVARAVVQANESALFSSGYRETPHRVYLYRLDVRRHQPAGWHQELVTDDGGLYIAAFRDVSVERAVISRAFLNGLFGPCLFLLSIIVAGMWVTGRIARYVGVGRDDWLWPNATFEPLYRRQAGMYGAALVVGYLLERFGAGTWAYVALPILAVAGGVALYARHPLHKVPRSALVQPLWHLLQFGLLGAALILVPAYGLFDMTIRHELGTLIGTERRWMADQIEDMKLSAEADARAEGMPVSIGTHAAAARFDRRPSPPNPFDADPSAFDAATLRLLAWHEWLDRGLPFENDRVTRLRYQRPGPQFAPAGLSIGPLGPVGAVGFIVLIAALVAWLHWYSTWLLFSDVPSAPELHPQRAQAGWDACAVDEKHVLLQIADEGVVNPRQRVLVLRLIEKGMVRLSPNLQISSSQLLDVVRRAFGSQAAMQATEQWERESDGRNWKDTRLALVVALAVVGLLVATQPGIPTQFAAVASGVTAVGGAGLRLRDVIIEWLDKIRKR